MMHMRKLRRRTCHRRDSRTSDAATSSQRSTLTSPWDILHLMAYMWIFECLTLTTSMPSQILLSKRSLSPLSMCPPVLKIFMWSKALTLLLFHAGKAPLRTNSSTLKLGPHRQQAGFTIVHTLCGPRVLNPYLFATHLRTDQWHTKGVRCAAEAACLFHSETKRGNVWRKVNICTHRCLGTWSCRLVTRCGRIGPDHKSD